MALVVKIGADLKKFDKEMKKLTRDVETVGEKFKTAGSNLTKSLTLPILALGAASTKSAIDFESAFAGVKKTVDATESEYAELRKSILDMTKEIPASAEEIAAVAEAAGQLGIEKSAIMGFTRTIMDLGEATNLTAEQAATEFARFANIVGMPQDSFDKLGSSIVALGNSMATTESEISSMAMRLAAQGKQVGLSEAEILALAASMSSLGIEAEAGGTAMTTILKKMQNAVSLNSKDLEAWAKAAGMSTGDFKKSFEKDAIKTLDSVLKGLDKTSKEGGNLTQTLEGLGIVGIRESDTMMRLVGASDLLSGAVETSSGAWKENTALSNEASQRYATTASQLSMLWNQIKSVAITIGDALLPVVMTLIESLQPLLTSIEQAAEWFKNLDPPLQNLILAIVAFVAALGPLLSAIGVGIILFGQIQAALAVLGVGLGAILGPVALVIAAIIGIIAAFVLFGDEIKAFYNTYFKPVIDQLIAMVVETLKPAFTQAFQTISNVVRDSFTLMKKLYKDILEPVLKVIIWYVQNVVIPKWRIAFSVVSEIFRGFFRTVSDLWNKSLKPVFNGIIDFINGVFTGNWDKAWNGLKDIFKGVFQGMITLAKAPLRQIISAVNGFIKGINKIKIPNWVPGVGGKGINIPLIPELATGGNIFGNGSAIVGEAGPELIQKSGSSVKVTPLSAQEKANGIGGGSNRPLHLTIMMDGETIAKYTKEHIDTMMADDVTIKALMEG